MMECNNHRLETREAYFPKENKKGTITWCENPGCNYVVKKMDEGGKNGEIK